MRRASSIIGLFIVIATSAAAQPVNVTQSVTARKQAKTNGCWATATVMLWQWKTAIPTSEEQLTDKAGAKFRLIYDANNGIQPPDEKAFYSATGLRVEEGLNPSIAGWATLLKKGPLSITVVYTKTDYHALVIYGIQGDGTPAGTTVYYVNPDPTKQSPPLAFVDFLKLYEGASHWPLQIMHWP